MQRSEIREISFRHRPTPDYARAPSGLRLLSTLIDSGVIQVTPDSRAGHSQIVIQGESNGSRVVSYWEIRSGKKTITLQSLWIGK